MIVDVSPLEPVRRGAPKQRQFVGASLIGVTTSSTTGVDVSRSVQPPRLTTSASNTSTASPWRCCSDCQDERRERMKQRLEESYPGISRLWRSRSKPLAHEVDLTPQGSIA